MSKKYALKTVLPKQDMQAMRSILSDWYGAAQGYDEVSAHASVPVMKVGDVATDILSSLAGADAQKFVLLDEKLAEIVGPTLAKMVKLNSIKHGVVYIEVGHPALIRELQGRLKTQLLEQINQTLEKKIAVDIKFIPGNGRNSN